MFSLDYPAWLRRVDVTLRIWSGRPLADAPAHLLDLLPLWYAYGVPAKIVGQGLSTRMQARATAVRFYTDDPAWLVAGRLEEAHA